MASKKWIITTSSKEKLDDIQKVLKETGFTVNHVMEEIGCISGTATDDVAEKLRKIPGVTDVSPDGEINIGPPGASETW
jgi:inosine/xanthosine triphosphate pyrophosphatase family protein